MKGESHISKEDNKQSSEICISNALHFFKIGLRKNKKHS